jgi:hypothetical protein
MSDNKQPVVALVDEDGTPISALVAVLATTDTPLERIKLADHIIAALSRPTVTDEMACGVVRAYLMGMDSSIVDLKPNRKAIAVMRAALESASGGGEVRGGICEECGMAVSPTEYHPQAACVLFRFYEDADEVRHHIVEPDILIADLRANLIALAEDLEKWIDESYSLVEDNDRFGARLLAVQALAYERAARRIRELADG